MKMLGWIFCAIGLLCLIAAVAVVCSGESGVIASLQLKGAFFCIGLGAFLIYRGNQKEDERGRGRLY